MTDHKYVFQGPVGQMQLSHCTVYVQGIVEKLNLEDCNVQVSGIVQQRYDISKHVVVDDKPKSESGMEVWRLRREISELQHKLRNSQSNEDKLRAKIKELKESGAQEPEPSDDVLVQRICTLRDTIDRERDAHAKEVAELKDRLDTACEINAKLRNRYEDDDRRSEEIADRHVDILATLMAAFPFTPTEDLSFEIGLPAHRIRYVAEAFNVLKSKEKREEAREYLRKQQMELVDRRGGDQGHHYMRAVEKVSKKGRVLATYRSVADAASRSGFSTTTIQKYCQAKDEKKYTSEGFTFRYKE